MFSCEYYDIFKNTYFEENLRTAASIISCHWSVPEAVGGVERDQWHEIGTKV